MWLLDTNILIDFSKGSLPSKEWLQAKVRDCRLSALVVAEFVQGIQTPAEMELLESFKRICPVLPISDEVAMLGGQWSRQYRRSHGCNLHDCLIAATAHIHGLKVATLNTKHLPMFDALTAPY